MLKAHWQGCRGMGVWYQILGVSSSGMQPAITLRQISEGHGDHYGWEVVQSLDMGNQLLLVTKLEESLQQQKWSQESDPHPQ